MMCQNRKEWSRFSLRRREVIQTDSVGLSMHSHICTLNSPTITHRKQRSPKPIQPWILLLDRRQPSSKRFFCLIRIPTAKLDNLFG